MNDKFRVIFQKLKRPAGWFLASIYILSAAFIAAALYTLFWDFKGLAFEILSYVFYGLAAIGLAYSVYTIVIYAPGVKRRLIGWMRKSPLVNRLLENYGFRTVAFAGVSTVINIAYVAFNGVLSVLYLSLWYGALAGYYVLLTAMRGGILLYYRKQSAREKKRAAGELLEGDLDEKSLQLKKYFGCGVTLIVLPFFLSFAILEMVVNGNAFVHIGWTIYAVAAYAFYKITMAIINVVKARRGDDMTIRALRAVALADATVSILALQTTLLYAFSNGGAFVGFANALTGGVVCALTVALGVYMLVVAGKKKREEKEGENDVEERTEKRDGNV